jgi:tetratricopeptide (TPR) repeat protein
MQADRRYRAAYPRPGLYNMYMAHNAHFLAFVAMMQGRSNEALRCAHAMLAEVPEDFVKEYATIADGFMIFESEVLMRFGRWEELLAAPEPAANLPLSHALWRYTRTSALIALNRLEQAQEEQALFIAAVKKVPSEGRFGNNSAADLLAIAGKVLEGEMAARRSEFAAAVAALTEASSLEDQLLYDEPPDWIQPVRHTLGAVLLRANRPSQAEKVYREDLLRYPGNGWSLMGLRDSLRQQGKSREATEADSRFKKAWATADIRPSYTCYCQQQN